MDVPRCQLSPSVSLAEKTDGTVEPVIWADRMKLTRWWLGRYFMPDFYLADKATIHQSLYNTNTKIQVFCIVMLVSLHWLCSLLFLMFVPRIPICRPFWWQFTPDGGVTLKQIWSRLGMNQKKNWDFWDVIRMTKKHSILTINGGLDCKNVCHLVSGTESLWPPRHAKSRLIRTVKTYKCYSHLTGSFFK